MLSQVKSASESIDLVETFDALKLRKDFPTLDQEIRGRRLVYLDNGASAQTPQCVLDAIIHFYQHDYSNIHRGVHTLSQRATRSFEDVRVKVQKYLNARKTSEIIFTRGTTEAINLVAQTYGRSEIGEGDEIIITAMEHHSNIVPWQMLCEEKGAILRVVPMNDKGELILDEYEKMLNARTKIVALIHVSNALGSINPVKMMTEKAHEFDIPVLLDGAQAAPHMKIDVQDLDCDFYALSGHKLFGPTGIGVLYGRQEILEKMPPYQGGGDMILSVSFEGTKFNVPPHRFEAGTPNIAGTIGLGAAIDYLEKIGIDRIAAYEHSLLEYATEQLSSIPTLRLIGTAEKKASVLSFLLEGLHPHDIGTILDQQGIAIRAGHHCAQPVMERFGIPATARASLAFYNTKEEVDLLVQGIHKTIEIFS